MHDRVHRGAYTASLYIFATTCFIDILFSGLPMSEKTRYFTTTSFQYGKNILRAVDFTRNQMGRLTVLMFVA
jgi:hypothetical protein